MTTKRTASAIGRQNVRAGKAAELAAAAILTAALDGLDPDRPVRRAGTEGRREDTGDLDGPPNTLIQVKALRTNVLTRGVIQAPLDAEEQRLNLQHRTGQTVDHAAVMLRYGATKTSPGVDWRVIQTVDQFARLWSAAHRWNQLQAIAERWCSTCRSIVAHEPMHAGHTIHQLYIDPTNPD